MKTNAQKSESKKSSAYNSLNAGTFLATQTKIESKETAKLLERFNSPRVSFGVSCILEKHQLSYSGSLATRILPAGFKLLFRNKDLIGTFNENGNFDNFYQVLEYYFDVLSIPLKFGYQTLINKVKQKFFLAAGIEANFITEMGLSMGSARTSTDLETE